MAGCATCLLDGWNGRCIWGLDVRGLNRSRLLDMPCSEMRSCHRACDAKHGVEKGSFVAGAPRPLRVAPSNLCTNTQRQPLFEHCPAKCSMVQRTKLVLGSPYANSRELLERQPTIKNRAPFKTHDVYSTV